MCVLHNDMFPRRFRCLVIPQHVSFCISNEWLTSDHKHFIYVFQMFVDHKTVHSNNRHACAGLQVVRFPNPFASGSDIHGSWGTWLRERLAVGVSGMGLAMRGLAVGGFEGDDRWVPAIAASEATTRQQATWKRANYLLSWDNGRWRRLQWWRQPQDDDQTFCWRQEKKGW